MDLTTFNHHLDRFGHRLEDWPEALGAEARGLLDASAEARSALQHSARLSSALGALKDQPAPAGLQRRILAQVHAEAAGAGPDRARAAHATENGRGDFLDRLTDWISGALWRPALAATATVAFGFALGLSLPATSLDDEELAAELGFLALSATYEELGDEN
ncbi:MAG: hypothetical protein AAGE43_08290 [Pseudomonadota bacterium]